MIKEKLIHPINVRGNYIYEVDKYDLHGVQFYHLPFFHTLDVLEKIKQTKLFTENKISIDELHPEVEFIMSSHINQFKNCSTNFNFLFDDHFNTDYFDVVKIKINRDLSNLSTIKNILNNEKISSVRLDGNKKLTAENLEILLGSFTPSELTKIEFIEEPLESIHEAQIILNKFNLLQAIDESLSLITDFHEFEYYIIKPSIYGFKATKNLIQKLAAINKKAIISSGYENSQGMNALIYLSDYSDQLIKKSLFHGLDTFKYFDLLNYNFQIEKNKISLN